MSKTEVMSFFKIIFHIRLEEWRKIIKNSSLPFIFNAILICYCHFQILVFIYSVSVINIIFSSFSFILQISCQQCQYLTKFPQISHPGSLRFMIICLYMSNYLHMNYICTWCRCLSCAVFQPWEVWRWSMPL